MTVQILSACHGASTMPDGVSLPVEFTSIRVYSGSMSATFEAQAQSIHVTGVVPVNVPCYDFSGSALLRGDTVDVVVLATPQPRRICKQELAAFKFDAYIKTVPRGIYTVTLRYKDQGLKYEKLIATTDLAVP